MNTSYTSRSRRFASAIAAAAITTVLVSSLVESFDPMQLLRLQEDTGSTQIAAVDSRKEADKREI